MIWYLPYMGRLSHVSMGVAPRQLFQVTPGAMLPGHVMPVPPTMKPTKAAMATRQCLSSAARYHSSVGPNSVVSARFSGSQAPPGFATFGTGPGGAPSRLSSAPLSPPP